MPERRVLQAELTWTGLTFEPAVQVEILESGRLGRIGRDLTADPEQLTGKALLPGFVNAHSHAFQRGLRGAGERFPEGAGSFWSWREAMYELVGSLDEEAIHRLSLQAFSEMRSAGVTCVGEFHYLHHSERGDDYALDAPVIEAARTAGIRLVLLYAYYRTGGFGPPGAEPALSGGQERFRTPSPEAYWQRMRELAGRLDPDQATLAATVHSYRAAPPDEVATIVEEARRRRLVLHLHLEEQRREIDECRQVHDVGPLELLLRNGRLDGVAAVHLTHSEATSIERLADAGGAAILCPCTEADLGDGIPDLPAMQTARLPLALGTDSNVRISMLEEMRWLEYVQRLARQQRGVARDPQGTVARRLLQTATRGGAAALGARVGALEPGRWADLLAIELEHPSLAGATTDSLAECIVFGAGDDVVSGTWVGGAWAPARSDRRRAADAASP